MTSGPRSLPWSARRSTVLKLSFVSLISLMGQSFSMIGETLKVFSQTDPPATSWGAAKSNCLPRDLSCDHTKPFGSLPVELDPL